MSNRSFLILSLISVLLIGMITFCGSGKSEASGTKANPAFAGYISGFTAGVIPAGSDIRIILAADHREAKPGEEIEEKLFSFDPSIIGKTYWTDNRTITFNPDEPLAHDQLYEATFNLGKLADVPDDLKKFTFSFKTIPQTMDLVTEGLHVYRNDDLSLYYLTGFVQTGDAANPENLRKSLNAIQNGQSLSVRWTHEEENRLHRFVIDSIHRGETSGLLDITFNGKPISSESTGERKVRIPALDEFIFLSERVVQSPEQYVVLNFSDPIPSNLDIEGLISLDPRENIRLSVEGNNILLYPADRLSGERSLIISEGIKNTAGFPLANPQQLRVKFEELKPAVRLSGNGVIVPSGEGMLFPFEAVNLRAIDVTIFRIYENNIAQFLQVNTLSGSSEIRRVGRKVLQKVVPLSNSTREQAGWNTYHLDLSTLINAEPGAIYKVTLGFKKEYASYFCAGEAASNAPILLTDNWTDENEDNPSDYYYEDDYYYYDYDDEYEWDERDNPCHTSYYQYGRTVSRNIIASDLGLIAKQGTDGKLVIAVSNINTTDPVPAVELEVYNFQQQLISRGSTDQSGFAEINLRNKPFLLVAKKGSQRGYLRLDDGSSLSQSAFDVSGEVVQKGLKGFIYTERGVWRPGDSIHVSFILEDKAGSLPQGHPVTCEFYNPMGQLLHQEIKNNGVNGFYYFPVKTDEQSVTGNYQVKIKAGGAQFSKMLKVETIMPNRLKIRVGFDGDAIYAGKENTGSLQARWLHGAKAPNLKTRMDVVLSRSTTAFPAYKGFDFDDDARAFSSKEITFFEGRLDESGSANIPSEIDVSQDAPGVMHANFTVRVFEESGAFSIDRFSVPWYPYEIFAGLNTPAGDRYSGALQTDSTYFIDIATVTSAGKPAGGRTVRAEIYKIDWRWWWDRHGDDLSDYLSGYYQRKAAVTTLQTDSKGRAQWKVNIPRHEWGRYMIRIIDEDGGHAASEIVYFDWPSWYRGNRELPGAATMLMFSSDKEKYATGEDVRVTIPTPEAGTALITLENGRGVIHKTWLKTGAGETVWSFKAEPGMAPNLYVTVTLLQPHSQTANDLPIRMYGILPVAIEDPETRLAPQISMQEVLQPETTASITVSEKSGKPMTYTLALVDEGLLDLTRFKTPDPWGAFYAREALGVKTWDLFDFVLGAMTSELKRILAIGGDESGKVSGTPKANRFKPMVIFRGPFTLKKGDSNTHQVDIPRYVGSVRVMVIAGQNGAYGNAEKAVPVRKPLMLLATLPRIVSTGEDVSLPVNVFAMEKNIKDVSVTLTSHNGFSLNGSKQQTIRFEDTGDQLVFFNLKASDLPVTGKVTITAKSGNQTATEEIEIAVQNPNKLTYQSVDEMIDKGSSAEISFTSPGIPGTNVAWLEVSSLPSMNLERRLKYLISYPFGCIEQTVSGAFAQLYLGNLMELNEKDKEAISTHIKAALESMKKFQLSDGSFSYWPGTSQFSEWGTSYAGHFIIEAKRQGYAIPSQMINNWKRFQKQRAITWSPQAKNRYGYTFRNDDLMQAYRLYTLAIADAPENGAMNRLREMKDLSVAAKWRLAAAYASSGKTDVARSVVNGVSSNVKEYRELSYTYGSSLRDKAMILETMHLVDDRKNALLLLREIAAEVGNREWLSTQELGYSLYAVSLVADAVSGGGINTSVTLSNGKTQTITTQEPFRKIMMPEGKNGGTIKIKNQGNNVVFARVVTAGIPPLTELPAISNSLSLNVNYLDMDGNRIAGETLDQGTDLIVEVTVTHPGIRGPYEEMALSIPVASGWEIINQRMSGADWMDSSIPEYMDIRDDKVNYFFDLGTGKSVTFRFKATATYAGRFYLPPVTCEAMYDRSIYAREGGNWVSVNRPTSPL